MLKIELSQGERLTNAEYIEKNKLAWEEKVQHDILSEYYDVSSFLSGNSTLDQLEMDGLGDVKNKKLLNLQCYFGLESLSLERLGADVTGLDFCNNAINQAILIRNKAGLKTKFINANVYDSATILDKQYDIIFSSYGSICWLPDLSKWVENIYKLLKLGGFFYLIDFHPLLISFNLSKSKSIKHSYFNSELPLELTRTGTYADNNAKIKTIDYNWNHSLSEIFSAFISKNMKIEDFKEYPYIPLNAFPNLIKQIDGYNHVKNDMFPVLFTLKIRK